MKKIITLLLVLTGMVCTASAQDSWTVAGSSALFGTNWDPTDTNNDMTLVGGIYVWEKTGYVIEATEVEFRVVKNHNWENEAYPSSNYYVGSLTSGRKYDVKITYNPDDKAVNAEFKKWPEIASVELRGSFSWWGANALTLNDGVYTGTIDLTNTIDDQWFKLVAFDTDGTQMWDYYGSSTDFSDCGEGLIAAETDDSFNFLLKNSTSGYKTYSVSVTWTPNASFSTGWKVTINGATARPATTYTVTVLNDASWGTDGTNPGTVYAHAWNKVDDVDVPVTGEWPGKRLMSSYKKTIDGTEYEVYTFTLESAPEKILFNIGSDASQTRNLAFINGKEYYTYRNYTVAGNSAMLGTWWDTEDFSNLMTRSADGNYVLVKSNKELTKDGEYTFKICTNGWAWPNYGKDGGTENAELAINEDGKYDVTFTLNESTHVPTATGDMLERKATIGADGKATFSSVYDLDFTDVTELTAYRAESAANGSVKMKKVEGKVPANTGLYLEGETAYIPVTTGASAIGDNLLVATDGTDIYNNDGTHVQYVLANQSGVGFYKVGSSLEVDAGKAYLETEGSVASARLAISFDDDTTGISNIEATKQNVECYHNLAGQRVAQPTKGLYIVNGKKVIVK